MKQHKKNWLIYFIFSSCLIFIQCASKQQDNQSQPLTPLEQSLDFISYLKTGNFVELPSNYLSATDSKAMLATIEKQYLQFSRQQRYNCRQMSIIIDSIDDNSSLKRIYFHTNYTSKKQYLTLQNEVKNSYKIIIDTNFNLYRGI